MRPTNRGLVWLPLPTRCRHHQPADASDAERATRTGCDVSLMSPTTPLLQGYTPTAVCGTGPSATATSHSLTRLRRLDVAVFIWTSLRPGPPILSRGRATPIRPAVHLGHP